MKLAWVTPWERVCGIADYSKELWPALQKYSKERGDEINLVSLDKFSSRKEIVEHLTSLKPDVIHFQHEYGLFGGKNPPFYNFPFLIEDLRAKLPKVKLLATAHTVIPRDYKFPLKGKGWQIPIRSLMNGILLKRFQKYWGPRTWGILDGTITHSQLQAPFIRDSLSPYIEVVPHFVPEREKVIKPKNEEKKNILVFGFFTSEKGQDVVIESIKNLSDLKNLKFTFAGGVRRGIDKKYFDHCLKLIHKFKIEDRVKITGYIPADEVQKYFQMADLVITPFRETSGSGSISQALARGLPVLASDLPLNLEINKREPGTLAFFKSEDPTDLAHKIREIIFDEPYLKTLSLGAIKYSAAMSPLRVAFQHLVVYDHLLLKE